MCVVISQSKVILMLQELVTTCAPDQVPQGCSHVVVNGINSVSTRDDGWRALLDCHFTLHLHDEVFKTLSSFRILDKLVDYCDQAVLNLLFDPSHHTSDTLLD